MESMHATSNYREAQVVETAGEPCCNMPLTVLDDLPDELICKILAMCDFVDKLESLTTVCKRFSELLRNPSVSSGIWGLYPLNLLNDPAATNTNHADKRLRWLAKRISGFTGLNIYASSSRRPLGRKSPGEFTNRNLPYQDFSLGRLLGMFMPHAGLLHVDLATNFRNPMMKFIIDAEMPWIQSSLKKFSIQTDELYQPSHAKSVQSLCKLTSLTHLSVTSTAPLCTAGLLMIPAEISQLRLLQRLEVTLGVACSPLPTELASLLHLTALELSAPPSLCLNTLPRLTGLEVLHLGWGAQSTPTNENIQMALDGIGTAAAQLTRLTALSLQHISLPDVPVQIRSLPRLRELRMEGHEMNGIPRNDLFFGDNVACDGHSRAAHAAAPHEDLIQNCKLDAVPALEQQKQCQPKDTDMFSHVLPCLTLLQLDSCKLRRVPLWVSHLTALRQLSLTHNMLGSMPEDGESEAAVAAATTELTYHGPFELPMLPVLECLDISGSHNCICRIPDVAQLTALTHLRAVWNVLDDLEHLLHHPTLEQVTLAKRCSTGFVHGIKIGAFESRFLAARKQARCRSRTPRAKAGISACNVRFAAAGHRNAMDQEGLTAWDTMNAVEDVVRTGAGSSARRLGGYPAQAHLVPGYQHGPGVQLDIDVDDEEEDYFDYNSEEQWDHDNEPDYDIDFDDPY